MPEVPWKKRPMRSTHGVTSVLIPYTPPDKRDRRDVAQIVNQELRQRHLTAASKRIEVSLKDPGHRKLQTASWQQEIFSFIDQVGELHYAGTNFSSAASQVKLELTRRDEKGDWVMLSDKESLDESDKMAQEAMRDLSWDISPGEILRDLSAQIFYVGEAFLVGVPSRRSEEKGLLGLEWNVYSKEDVQEKNGIVVIDGKEYSPDSVLIIRVWKPHPRFKKDCDSPVRSTLPVLRELVGLTMHVSATIDSRLAGAGIVWMPQSATVLGMGGSPENADEEDPFLEAVIEAGVTAIKDRDSAAAIIPVFATLPDDVGFTPIHMSFSTPFDAATKDLRDEAIRRLALSLDMPPEVLLGTGGSSHWSAWAVSEDYIRQHVLPAVGLIARALVKDYLRPVLEEMGLPPALADEYSLLPTAEHMFSRPNRFDEAMELFRMDAINLQALLETAGFDQKDGVEREVAVDHAVLLSLRAAAINPGLLDSPGLLSMVSQFRAALSGKDLSTASIEELPPAMQIALNQGPESDETQGSKDPRTALPANDKTKGPPESDKDRTPNSRGPAKTRARDGGGTT